MNKEITAYAGQPKASLEEIEKVLKAQKPIIFLTKTVYDSVEGAVVDFFKRSAVEGTYEEGMVYCKCLPDKYRSFTDVYRFVMGIFPDVSVKEVIDEVRKLIMNKDLYVYYCSTIKRGVFPLIQPFVHTRRSLPEEDRLYAPLGYVGNGAILKNEFGWFIKEFYNLPLAICL